MKKKQVASLLQDVDKISELIGEKLDLYNEEFKDETLRQYQMATDIIIADSKLKLQEQMHIDQMNLINSMALQNLNMMANMVNVLAHIADSINAIAGGIIHEQRPDVSEDDLGLNVDENS